MLAQHSPRNRTIVTIRLLHAISSNQHRRPGGRLPRQLQPDAIRLEYFNAISAHLRAQQAPLRAAAQDALTLLVEERRQQTLRGDRMDAGRAQRAAQIIARAGVRAADAFAPRALHAVAEKFGKRTSDFNREQLDKQVRQAIGVPFSAVERPIRDLIPTFAKANVELVKTVPERYHDRLAKDVREAFESGMHPETLARRFVELDAMAESDARRIARDQIGKLNAQFNQERQESLGVVSYTWRTAKDNRVRDEHADREGQHFDWADPPEDGNPGEPIQCRCFPEPDFSQLIADL